MKPIGNLLEQITELDNLKRAFTKASPGKQTQSEVITFRQDLDHLLAEIADGLRRGNVPVGQYHYFRIYDPKERLICAASFRERVLHQAVMGPCETVFEQALIHHTYACRKGKGQTGAMAAARANAQRGGYFLKLDIGIPTAIGWLFGAKRSKGFFTTG